MKKIKFILPLLGLISATAVYAYSGSHSFTAVSVSNPSHSYKGDFAATGSFPFNGAGVFDKSRVNLKGTLTLTEEDGVPVNYSTCFTINGTLRTTGGTVKTTEYTDTSCSIVAKRASYYVNSYSENGIGDFTSVVTDGQGVVSTLSGSHSYLP